MIRICWARGSSLSGLPKLWRGHYPAPPRSVAAPGSSRLRRFGDAVRQGEKEPRSLWIVAILAQVSTSLGSLLHFLHPSERSDEPGHCVGAAATVPRRWRSPCSPVVGPRCVSQRKTNGMDGRTMKRYEVSTLRQLATVSTLVALLLGAAPAWAIVASPYPFEAVQPDGQRVQLHIRGDEHFQWLE